MRRISRSTRLAVLAALGFICAFFFFVGPWPKRWADDRFAWRDPRPENAIRIAMWSRSLSEPDFQPGELRAGSADIDILSTLEEVSPRTSVASLPLGGYGKRVFHKSNDGVADPIRAKALVLDNGRERIAIATADVLLINRGLADAVMARLKRCGVPLQRRQVYFAATHTHSSLGGYADDWMQTLSLGRRRPEMLDAIATSLARAIAQAGNNVEPCEFAWAAKQLPEGQFVKNRTIDGGPANRWLDLLTVRRASDRSTLASLIVFSAHATCRSSRDLSISSDYPGVLTTRVEQSTMAPCLFLAGAVGGMGPPELGPPRSQWANQLGGRLAEESLELARACGRYRTTVELAAMGGEIVLPSPSIKLPGDFRLSPFASKVLLPEKAWLQAVRLADRILVATPADYGGELSLEIRNSSLGLVTIVTSFGGAYIGYVLPDLRYDLGTYEPRNACLYGPRLAECFDSALSCLTSRLVKLSHSPEVDTPKYVMPNSSELRSN